jgi:cell division protein FtsW (lipid II flippase)
LNFAVYAPVQQILSLAMFVVFVDTADVNVWFPVLSVTLPFVAYGVLQCAVLAACVLMAYYRVQRLSE